MKVVFRSARRFIVPSRFLTRSVSLRLSFQFREWIGINISVFSCRLQDTTTSWEDQHIPLAAENKREARFREFDLRSLASKSSKFWILQSIESTDSLACSLHNSVFCDVSCASAGGKVKGSGDAKGAGDVASSGIAPFSISSLQGYASYRAR